MSAGSPEAQYSCACAAVTGPNVTSLTEIAGAALEAGADGLSLINTVFGMRQRDNKSGFVIARKEVLEDVLTHRFDYAYYQSFITVAAASTSVVAVSDSKGAVVSAKGLPARAVLEHKGETGSVVGFEGAETVNGEELLGTDCLVLVLAALEESVTDRNAGDIRASLVVETANYPVTPEGEEALIERGVTVVPDILASGGGVSVSYLEWVQDLQREQWSEARVNARLAEVMAAATDQILARASAEGMPLREAAHFIALGGDVRFASGHVPGSEQPDGRPPVMPREGFVAFCDELLNYDTEQLIERYRKKYDLPLSSPRVAQLDLAYHDLRRGRGLYNLMERRGSVDRVVRDVEIFEAKEVPPQTTRARLRGEFIRRAQEKRRDFTVDWVHLKLNDQAQRTVLCKDPFRSVDERVDQLIAHM